MEKKVPLINEFDFEIDLSLNKFIQLYIKGEPYLRFINPYKEKYHFEILENILTKEFGIYFERIGGIPEKFGEDYKMVGAGRFHKFRDKIMLYGDSSDYSLGPDKEHARKISKKTGLNFLITSKSKTL